MSVSLRSRSIAALCLALWFQQQATAQNVGINAKGAAPNASALLDIDGSAIVGTKRGLLIRITQRLDAAEKRTAR